MTDTGHGTGLGALAQWDIWSDFERIRSQISIVQGMGGCYDELPMMPNFWMAEPDQPTFLVLGFASARKVLSDGPLFSSRRGGPAGVLFGTTGAISESDDPYHARLRRLIMPAFRRSTMGRWRAECFEPARDRLLTELRGRRSVDIKAELLYPFPYLVTAGVLGFSDELHDRSHALIKEV